MSKGYLILVAICITIAGCDRQNKEPIVDVSLQKTNIEDSKLLAVVQDSALTAADQQLGRKIREALQQNTAMIRASSRINIIIENGMVTLQGAVSSFEDKARLTNIINQIDGIKKLDNQIEVSEIPDLQE